MPEENKKELPQDKVYGRKFPEGAKMETKMVWVNWIGEPKIMPKKNEGDPDTYVTHMLVKEAPPRGQKADPDAKSIDISVFHQKPLEGFKKNALFKVTMLRRVNVKEGKEYESHVVYAAYGPKVDRSQTVAKGGPENAAPAKESAPAPAPAKAPDPAPAPAQGATDFEDFDFGTGEEPGF
jgi:hypothetical protein